MRSAAAAAALSLLVQPAAAVPTADVAQLAGLWKGELRFGPDIRGPLVIRREKSGWTADFMGRTYPVTVAGDIVGFKLPDGQGRFEGRLQVGDGGAILGRWFQAPTQRNHAVTTTPLSLRPDGVGRWAGEVRPFDDNFVFYLKATAQPEGSVNVFTRNPERNAGVFDVARRFELDGDTVKLVGHRRGSTKEVVLAQGRFDAQGDRFSLAMPRWGGTYDFRREGADSDFYPRPPGTRYAYSPPLPRDDGWPVATLAEVGIDRAGIERFIQMLIDLPTTSEDTSYVHAVLIARHGKLVLEEYFHGEHRDKLHDTRSAAKSLTATIAGAAMHAGAPLAPSTPVYATMNGGTVPPGLEPRKRAMTLENLLTMTSGFFCDDRNPAAPGNEDVMWDQEDEPDFYRYALKLPMAEDPGKTAVYCSTNPNLVGGIVAKATGEPFIDTFDRLVAGPLRFGRYAWYLDPAGHAYGGGGVHMLPRDFMKLGQLMLDGGTWKGRRILDKAFVDRAASPLYDLRGIKYGYLWWAMDHPYKGRTVRSYFAGGNGGQTTMVVPELDLVIQFYGGNYSSEALYIPQRVYVPRDILPAVRE